MAVPDLEQFHGSLLLVGLVIHAVLSVVFGVGLGWALFFLPLLLVFQILFTTGVTCILAAGQVYFRDVQYFLSVLITLWFFGTPIVYPIDLVPRRLRPLFEANPMAWLVSSYHDIWFYRRPPGVWHLLGFAVVSVLVAIAGLAAYRRLSLRFAEEV